MSSTLVILAAGMGSRYGGLKQLDGFGMSGETLMEYSIYDAIQCGFDKVVFVIRRDMAAAFDAQFKHKIRAQIAVAYVFQERVATHRVSGAVFERDKPWGTVHALLAAKEAVQGTFVVINADDFYGQRAYRLGMAHFSSERNTEIAPQTVFSENKDRLGHNLATGFMVGYPLGKVLSAYGTVSRGLCRVDERGYLRSITEATGIIREIDGRIVASEITGDLAEDMPISMNFWGFNHDIFDLLANIFDDFLEKYGTSPSAECYISSSINDLIAVDRMAIRVIADTNLDWMGVTYQADRATVIDSLQRYVSDGWYPERLWGE